MEIFMGNSVFEFYRKRQGLYKNITKFVDSIVTCYCTPTKDGYQLNIEDIPEKDLLKFASLLVEYHNRDLFFLVEDNCDLSSSLIRLLTVNNSDSLNDYHDCLKNKILNHYRKTMEEILEDRLLDALQKENFERERDVSMLHKIGVKL
jgi:hypothetical protein